MRPARHTQTDEQKISELLVTDEGRNQFVHTLLDSLGPEGRAWLQKRVLGTPETEDAGNSSFAALIGARQGTPAQIKALEIASLIKFFEYRKALLASAIPATKLAEMLGVSRQTIHDRLKNGQLLGVMDNNALRFPSWQFDPQGPNGIVDGLIEVVEALDGNIFAKISWLSSPSPIFDGASPIDVLKNGGVADVVREARAVGVS